MTMPAETIMNRNNQEMPAEQWREAAQDLARRSDPGSLVELLRFFYEPGRAGKQFVIAAFRDKPDGEVFPALERALREHENANRRNAAMEVYCALGSRSLQPLLALLRDADEEIRTFVCVMLGNMGSTQAVPDLIRMLADPDLNVKHAAAEALGKIRDPRALDPLIRALSSDLWIQFPAAVALGDIGDARAVQPLIALLAVPGANVPAIQALGKLGDAAAIEPLRAYLEDQEPSLREWALEALAKVLSKNPRYRPPTPLTERSQDALIETLKSDSLKARKNAAIVLGCFRVERAAPAIAAVLPDRETSDDAIEALVRIGGDSALPVLDSCLRDTDPLVRRSAARVLAGLGTKRSLQAMAPLLSDPNEGVRQEAMLALSQSGSAEARGELDRRLETVSGAAREAGQKLVDAYAAITETTGPARGFNREDILPLRDFVSEKLGLYYDDERLTVLYQRISSLAATCGFKSLAGFHRHLMVDPNRGETIQKMASTLSNNETYFFREMEQLQTFMASALTELVKNKRAESRPLIRILSAGCSSGEEAYTLAMLLEEGGVRSGGCDVEILGMDVDRSVLRTAQSGRYPGHSFRRGESPLVKKYFHCTDAECAVTDRIRSLVRFTYGNLMECPELGRFDAIFCRNVLIYFTDRSIGRVVSNFHRMLLPGGYLLLGHSESLCRVETDFEPVRLEGAVVYRKR